MKFDELGYFRKQVDDLLFVFRRDVEYFHPRIACEVIIHGVCARIELSIDFIQQFDEDFIINTILNEAKTSVKNLLKSNPKKAKKQIKLYPKLSEYL